MHFTEPSQTSAGPSNRFWWMQLSRYHWFVLIVAALGWLFDTMDQQLFNLARSPAISDLLSLPPASDKAKLFGGISTMIFMFGWASGGIIFGVMGDRIGRAKTMLFTILVYSLFTGLSALSQSVWDFAFYRFLTGLGVGGEFAVGVALVAEVMPDRLRTSALGALQASSALGNMMAAVISIVLGEMQAAGSLGGIKAWRLMFVIGTIPALLAIFIRRRLKEPERWQEAVKQGGGPIKKPSMRELFREPTIRKNAVVGLAMGFAGVVGLWGIGFFSFELVRSVFRVTFETQFIQQGIAEGNLSVGHTIEEAKQYLVPFQGTIGGKLTFWAGIVSLLQNFGGIFGIYGFSVVAQRIGRKPTFLISFLLAMGGTAGTFWFLKEFSDVFWMIPILGFCQLTLFGGYAIYFPELFPTRLRSTGISFCYNVGRFVAAPGSLVLSALATSVYGQHGDVMSWRLAGVTMCSVFLVGLVALIFAPETRGKPLPE